MDKNIMEAAIATAREMVLLTKKQDACIPVILAACGYQKAEKPWVVAKEVLVEYTKRISIPLELRSQRDLLSDLDARRTDLRKRLEIKFDKVLNAELVRAHSNFVKAEQRFEELKAKHSIAEKLSVMEHRIEKMGLMDLLVLKASDLTAAIHAEKVAFNPVPKFKLELKRAGIQDIMAEYGLDRGDMQVADLIVYLRNTMTKDYVKVKKHSKPRRRVEVDEDAVKMDTYAMVAEVRAKAAARYKAQYKGARPLIKVA